MHTLVCNKTTLLTVVIACALCLPCGAAVIVNGGFESGFTGWTRVDQTGSEGSFGIQTGTTSPVNGNTVPAPPGGTSAAMTDAAGPGSHVLYQTFTVTEPIPFATLVFDVFIGNRATDFVRPASGSLDFSTPALNQQARVDILVGSASPFSVAPADVLMNVLQTIPGGTPVTGYTHQAVNISALLNSRLNTPLMVRFAETDNVGPFQFGVDNVDISTVPEPSTWILSCAGLLGVVWVRRRLA